MYIRGLGWVSVDDSELVEPAASEAEGVEITDSIRKEIEDHVTALKSLVEAGKQKDAEAFAELLWKLACDNAANQATIVEAGGIEALVALVRSGAAPGQEQAARVLAQLAYNDATNQAAVAEAGGVQVGSPTRPHDRAARAAHALPTLPTRCPCCPRCPRCPRCPHAAHARSHSPRPCPRP